MTPRDGIGRPGRPPHKPETLDDCFAISLRHVKAVELVVEQLEYALAIGLLHGDGKASELCRDTLGRGRDALIACGARDEDGERNPVFWFEMKTKE